MFVERIKQLREELKLPQRKLAEALDIDSATYCKFEKGERKVKREQVLIIAKLLQTDKKELLTLWLADQVSATMENEKELAPKVIKIVQNNMLNITNSK